MARVLAEFGHPTPELVEPDSLVERVEADLADRPGTGVTEADGRAHADRAMELLRADADHRPHPLLLTEDPGFDSLRDRPDFGRLVAELERAARAANKSSRDQ